MSQTWTATVMTKPSPVVNQSPGRQADCIADSLWVALLVSDLHLRGPLPQTYLDKLRKGTGVFDSSLCPNSVKNWWPGSKEWHKICFENPVGASTSCFSNSNSPLSFHKMLLKMQGGTVTESGSLESMFGKEIDPALSRRRESVSTAHFPLP